ncbi:MAG: DNA recombination protein RmuC, partial [Bacteroidales bacterium]|nr:DNA recombination protein RmuC [Bacteroidales bacterium]
FKALSAENSRAFREQSAASIAEMLRPVREKFEAFDRSVSESRRESAAQSAALKENIENVLRHSRSVGDEARNLANALTGYSKVQGDFGEMLLTDVLRNAGLVEGVHFVTQGAIRDESGAEVRSEEGRRMIPDVLVFYPDDTMVVVDAKVSLKAYREYVLSESVEDRRRWAKAHVESVRAHVDELKAKDYASYVPDGRRKVAYNLMFVPMEGAFRLMLETDPLLWQAAKDNNVLIVSQMTLVIVLNMIQMAWKQADQEKNIAQVYRTAEELMGQLGGWLSSHAALGDALKKAVEAYGESTRKLKDSNQSVIRKIEKLERLGLSPKRSRGKVRTSSRGDASSASVIPVPLRPEEEAPEQGGEEA